MRTQFSTLVLVSLFLCGCSAVKDLKLESLSVSPSNKYVSGPEVNFTTTSSSSSEGNSITVYVELSEASIETINVPLTVSGNMTATDYTISSTVTFSPGQTSIPLNISFNEGSTYELSETFNLTLNSTTNANIGPSNILSVSVADNDSLPTVSWDVANQTVNEADGTVTITAQLSHPTVQSVSIPIVISGGDAVSGTDFNLNSSTVVINPLSTTGTATLTLLDNSSYENNETVIVTMTSASNASLGSTTSQTVTINNDDAIPTVAFQSTTSNIVESAGLTNIQVVVSGSTDLPIDIGYATVSGTASDGLDFNSSTGTLTLPPGTTSADITVSVIDTSNFEANETFDINLFSPVNAVVGTNFVHTVTIIEDDAKPTVNILSGTTALFESDAPYFYISVSLNHSSYQTITIPVSVTDITANSGDYNLATSTVTISPGQTSGNIRINVIDDSTIESPETFTVTIGTPTNAFLGSTVSHTGKLMDDDQPYQWTGRGADSNWTNPSNWTNATVPSSGFVAKFNGNCFNCDAIINSNINVYGIEILGDYPGVITQSTSWTITLGLGGYQQANGTFIGGNGNIVNNGSFTLTGGSFTETSGQMFVKGNWLVSGSPTYIYQSSLLTFSASSSSKTITPGNIEYGNVMFNGTSASYNLSTGTMKVNGILKLAETGSGQINNGYIAFRSNINFTNLGMAGNATMIANGTGNQTYTVSSGANNMTGLWVINKSSGNFELGNNLTISNNLNLSSGILNANGYSVSIGGNLTLATSTSLNLFGGSLTVGGITTNNGTINP